MTRQEFHALALEIEDAFFAAHLKESELRVARLIVKLSLRSERTTTPQLRQKDFAEFAGIRETHIAETIGWLLGKKVIELEAPNVYRPNPQIESWLVKERVTAAAKVREAELLRSSPELFGQSEIRAGDPRVALPDAQIAVAAEAVKLPKFGSLTSEIRKSESSEIRKSHETRVHARARHDHESSASQSMLHDHVHAPVGVSEEELKPAERDLLEQIEELTAAEGKTEHFATTWRMRVRESPIAAFQAIGETRTMKREGRIKRTVGGALNWHFKNFQAGARNLARKVHLLFC